MKKNILFLVLFFTCLGTKTDKVYAQHLYNITNYSSNVMKVIIQGMSGPIVVQEYKERVNPGQKKSIEVMQTNVRIQIFKTGWRVRDRVSRMQELEEKIYDIIGHYRVPRVEIRISKNGAVDVKKMLIREPTDIIYLP